MTVLKVKKRVGGFVDEVIKVLKVCFFCLYSFWRVCVRDDSNTYKALVVVACSSLVAARRRGHRYIGMQTSSLRRSFLNAWESLVSMNKSLSYILRFSGKGFARLSLHLLELLSESLLLRSLRGRRPGASQSDIYCISAFFL